MIVDSRYFPLNKHSGEHELKENETYTEDLSIFIQPLELIDEFFKLLLKTDECTDIALVGKALVEQCIKRTTEYIEVSGDIEFTCAMENNTASIPGGTLLKVEMRNKETKQPAYGG